MVEVGIATKASAALSHLETKLDEMWASVGPPSSGTLDGEKTRKDVSGSSSSSHFPPSQPPHAAPTPGLGDAPGLEDYFPQQVELTVHVLNSHIGRIIGRGGQKIQEIERTSGASIQLSKPERPGVTFTPATLRSVSITGTESEVDHCQMLIEQCISQPNPGFKRGSKQAKQAAIGTVADGDGQETNSIRVPTGCVSRLLERKGLGVKRMQEQSGAKITLPKVRSEDPPDRMVKVNLSGSHVQVAACLKLMRNIIVELGLDAVGRGASIREVGSVYSRIKKNGTAPPPISYAALNAVPSGYTPTFADQTAGLMEQEELIVRIPNESVGRVIGKKGAHIKKIQVDSGARVYLPKDCAPGTAYREMKISGGLRQVRACVAILSRSMTPPGEQVVALDVTPVSAEGQVHAHAAGHSNLSTTVIGFDGTPYSVVGAHQMVPMPSVPYGMAPTFGYPLHGGNLYPSAGQPPQQQVPQPQMFDFQPQYTASPYTMGIGAIGGMASVGVGLGGVGNGPAMFGHAGGMGAPQGYSAIPMPMHSGLQPVMQQAMGAPPAQGMPPGTAVFAMSETEFGRIKPALTQIQSETGASIDVSEPFEVEADGMQRYDPCREIVIRGDMIAVHQCESMLGRILNRGPGIL